MKHYELLYIIAAHYSEEELAPLKDKINELIKKHTGTITIEDTMGKRKLAYPIKDVRHGYFLLTEFDLAPENLQALDRDLRLTGEIVRHQIVVKLPRPAGSAPRIKRDWTESETEMGEPVAHQTRPAHQAVPERKEERKEDDSQKIKLEDLDEKLDEILEKDMV